LTIELFEPLTVFAMMIGKDDPLDFGNAHLGEFWQHASIPQIDQQSRISVSQNIDVAGVRPLKKLRERFWIRLSEPLRCGVRNPDRQEEYGKDNRGHRLSSVQGHSR
jgi:hypothetical protein